MNGSAVAAALLVAVAGCAGSTPRATTTVAAYDIYPRDTISVPTDEPTSGECRTDARGFAKQAVLFVAHNGRASAYPADLYYVLMREIAADFQARRCEPELLGRALRTRVTVAQQRFLVRTLPKPMAALVREALSRADASAG